jgi:hypothetical protein
VRPRFTISQSYLTHPSSTLRDIKRAAEARLRSHVSTGKLGAVKKLVRSKGKDALCVPSDQEEINKLGAQLDRAVEELNVRNLVSHCCSLVLTPFISSSHRSG